MHGAPERLGTPPCGPCYPLGVGSVQLLALLLGAAALHDRGWLECKAARAAWMAEYRAAHPADYEHAKRMDKARSRALWRLAREHSDEFHALVADEIATAS